jgi:hypothetical protein
MGIRWNQFLQIYSKDIILMLFVPVAFTRRNGAHDKKYLHHSTQNKTLGITVNIDYRSPMVFCWVFSKQVVGDA